MRREPLICVACGDEISGLGVFGEAGQEMCWDCWSALAYGEAYSLWDVPLLELLTDDSERYDDCEP